VFVRIQLETSHEPSFARVRLPVCQKRPTRFAVLSDVSPKFT